ncbi:hypothetical protein KUTeg_018173 [Tegillarca granosa]|uniref:Uncharacterized protein n=1 Tax=Tegillarca granosa TaxID=220873 RepID=A0ABQ9EMF1_TEGGR|nr:hypothetical protein KUTeg_018173 [Tegillarca granosa]
MKNTSFGEERLSMFTPVRWMEQQIAKKRVKRSADYYSSHRSYNWNPGWPDDPKWGRMWYLKKKFPSVSTSMQIIVYPSYKNSFPGKSKMVLINSMFYVIFKMRLTLSVTYNEWKIVNYQYFYKMSDIKKARDGLFHNSSAGRIKKDVSDFT